MSAVSLRVEDPDTVQHPSRGHTSCCCTQKLVVGTILVVVAIVGTILAVNSPWLRNGDAWIVEQLKLTNKPALDRREYEYAKFSNGLEVVSVYDESTMSSGFSVAVEAGSYLDPKALPGLAHFCEHMLFLGTKKYPDPVGFTDYLSKHGGTHNAYTSNEATVYYASIDKDGFETGLDMFADFFRAPLFNRTFVEKEVKAIDSEHRKNMPSSMWRLFRIVQMLASPASPASYFHTGNLETLYTEPQAEGYDTVRELEKFYEANYCPPRMRLVTFGPNSASEQIKSAFNKFSDIGSSEKCLAEQQLFDNPVAYPPESLEKFLHVKAVDPQGELWVMFRMPDLRAKYKSHPELYLEHVFAYAGEHSLQHVLKEELGLATGVSTSADTSGGSAGTHFWVVFELTPKGRANTKQVISTLFYYIHLMQKSGVDMEMFNSIAKRDKLLWNWAGQSDISSTVMGLSEILTRVDKQDLLSGDSLIVTHDAAYVQGLMDMLRPNNMIVVYVDPDFEETRRASSELQSDGVRTERFYGAQYSVVALKTLYGTGLVDLWRTWSWRQGTELGTAQKLYVKEMGLEELPEFKLPKEIKDIPQDVNLDFAKAPIGANAITKIRGEKPTMLINENQQTQVWYRQGSMTESPKVMIQFLLRTAAPKNSEEVSAKESLLFGLYLSMLHEEMEPKMVDLKSTGITAMTTVDPDHLSFVFAGFKHNLAQMMKLVMEGFKAGIESNQPRFDRIREHLREGLVGYTEEPYLYAFADRTILLNKDSYSNEENLEALRQIKLTDVIPCVDKLKKKSFQLTSLVMGNIAADEVPELHKEFQKSVPMKVNVPIEKVDSSSVVKTGRRVEIRKLNPRKDDGNHVTAVSIDFGVPDIKDTVVFGILGRVLQPAAFNELRTNQQLGYTVSGSVRVDSNVLSVGVFVQGAVMLPDDVEPQIDMVLTKEMPRILNEMTTTEFEAFKQSFANDLLEPPLSFSEEIGTFWPAVARGGHCSDKTLQYLKYLQEHLTSKQQLIEAWNKIIMADQPRSKLVIKYFSDTLEGGIPARPSAKAMVASLEGLGVPLEAINLATAEYDGALILSNVDSKARQQVLRGSKAGFYDWKVKCSMPDSAVLHV